MAQKDSKWFNIFLMVHKLSILVQDGQKWHSVVQNCQKCSKGIKYSPKGPTIVKSDNIWSNFIQNHPKWSKAVQNGPRIIKDQAGHSLQLKYPSRYFLYHKDFWFIFYLYMFYIYPLIFPKIKLDISMMIIWVKYC